VRRERERLKLQERLKREKLERMRLDANDGAGAGEARRHALPMLRSRCLLLKRAACSA